MQQKRQQTSLPKDIVWANNAINSKVRMAQSNNMDNSKRLMMYSNKQGCTADRNTLNTFENAKKKKKGTVLCEYFTKLSLFLPSTPLAFA